MQNVWLHVTCFPIYFRWFLVILSFGQASDYFAEMHRSRGIIHRETSGNLSPTGRIQTDSGSVSEAPSCHITLVSKSLLANKTMYKHKWKQTLTYKCAHMLTEALSHTHTHAQIHRHTVHNCSWLGSSPHTQAQATSYIENMPGPVQTRIYARNGHTQEDTYRKCTQAQNKACCDGLSH